MAVLPTYSHPSKNSPFMASVVSIHCPPPATPFSCPLFLSVVAAGYHDLMYRIGACLIIIVTGSVSPNLLFANEEVPSQQPSAKERLNQVLGPEGGIEVYKDAQGNTYNTTVLPNGQETIVVQPPQVPGFNVGPPLQLNGGQFQLPAPPSMPAKPPAPDFPQRGR